MIESSTKGLNEVLNTLRDQRDDLLAEAMRVGYARFKVPPLSGPEEFAQVRDSVFPTRTTYVEAATPRTSFGSDVFSSTNVPASREIAPHNENSYATHFPGHLLFYCFEAPTDGGATPVCDVREVLRTIDGSILKEFEERGWALVRNYSSHLGRPWQEAFATSEREEVDAYCAAQDVEVNWHGDRLQTRQVRPATVEHPVSHDRSWFNHVVFWHGSRLMPEIQEVLTREHGQDWPFQTFYGDGSPIPSDVIDHIASRYAENTESQPWQIGDLLLVDNLTAAHARQSYQGSRSVVVAMGTPLQRKGNAAIPANESRAERG